MTLTAVCVILSNRAELHEASSFMADSRRRLLRLRNALYDRCNILYVRSRRLVHNSAWLFAENTINTLVATLVSVFLARYLGPHDFGVLNFAISIVSIFAVLSTLGLDRVAIRDFSQGTANSNVQFGSIVALKLTGSLLATGLALACALFVEDKAGVFLWLVLLLSLANVIHSVSTIAVWFQSRLESRYSVWSNTSALLATALLKLLLIVANAPLIAFAAVTLLEALLVASLLIYFFVVRGNSLRTWTFDKAVANKLIRDGAPLALSTLAGFIYVHFDKLMLGSTVGMSSVGVYAVYTQMIRIPQMLFASINASATPAIMKSYAENRTDCLNRISRVITLNAWLALWAAVLLTLFGNQLIHLVFGGEFSVPRPSRSARTRFFAPSPVKPDFRPLISNVGRAQSRSSVVNPVSPASFGAPSALRYRRSLNGSFANSARSASVRRRTSS